MRQNGIQALHRLPWEPGSELQHRLLLVWLVALLLVAALLVVCVLGFRQAWSEQRSHILDNERHHAELLYNSGLARELHDQVLTLFILRDEATTEDGWQAGKGRALVAKDFSALINETRQLAGIGLLDPQGRELLRVDAIGGRAVIAANDELRDQSGSEAFKVLSSMQVGQLYVSRLQAGRDGKPVIRFGLPIRDRSGRFEGALLSEYQADEMLYSFGRAADAIDGVGMLLDGDGHWLVGGGQGVDLFDRNPPRQSPVFGDRYPLAWEKIQVADHGQFERPDGVITFMRKNPLELVRRYLSRDSQAFGYHWTVISFLPIAFLAHRHSQLADEYAGVAMTGLVVILLVTALVSLFFYRQKSEQSLAASSSFLRHLLASTPEVYHVCIRQGDRFEPVFFGPGFAELTGYHEEELLAAADSGSGCIFSFMYPDDAARKLATLLAKHTDDKAQFEFRFRHADGHVMWISSSSKLILNEAGEVIELISAWQDVSERKRIEAELQGSEARFRAYAEFSPVGIFQNDLQGNCIYVNRRCCEITGLTEAECMADGWSKRLHPDDVERVLDGWRHWWAAGDSIYRDEYRFVRSDGTVVWVSATGNCLRDAQGIKTGFIGGIVDVTSAHDLLAEVQRLSQRLIRQREEENHELARALHDDIGQALAGVHFFAESVRQLCRGGDHVAAIQRADELLGMVDALMQTVHRQLGQVRAGHLEDLGLKASLQELAAAWEKPGTLEFGLELQQADHLDWNGQLALFRVAQEALTNIIRHAGARHVRFRLENGADRTVLTIEDDGCGFVPAAVKNGYGLLGMREHLAAVGGRLNIVSTPGKGSVIRAEVPVSAGAEGEI